jgi:hypothetical protein
LLVYLDAASAVIPDRAKAPTTQATFLTALASVGMKVLAALLAIDPAPAPATKDVTPFAIWNQLMLTGLLGVVIMEPF